MAPIFSFLISSGSKKMKEPTCDCQSVHLQHCDTYATNINHILYFKQHLRFSKKCNKIHNLPCAYIKFMHLSIITGISSRVSCCCARWSPLSIAAARITPCHATVSFATSICKYRPWPGKSTKISGPFSATDSRTASGLEFCNTVTVNQFFHYAARWQYNTDNHPPAVTKTCNRLG